jgi:alpha-methylacyl-CoA racemase
MSIIENNQLLAGHTFIDLSHRLPGPLAGHLLAGLGAKVIKIEDHKFKDAFLVGLFASFDENFKEWYQELNYRKEVLRFDFSNSQDQENIIEIVNKSDGVIMGLPPKVQAKLKLNQEDFDKRGKPLAVIEMLASKSNNSAMHDLNALALTGLLSLYVEGQKEKVLAPPFLPVSGIAFGQKAAFDLLAATILAKKNNSPVYTKAYLLESTKEIFDPFWPKKSRKEGRLKFLHNGLYPCYSLYRTKDEKYIGLAAVEEKFWLKLCELFNLEIEPEKRFHSDDNSVFKQLSNCFSNLTQEQISKTIEGNEVCLSLI